LRLRTAETLSLAARFYRRYLWSWDVTAGFLAALVAFALRAYASGSLIPLSITDIVNYLQQDNGHGLRRAILMLAASAVLFSATEWLFRPFWASIARGIANIKARLISGAPRGQDPSDLVGRLASDVDFVMWNLGGMYTTFVPNLLTALVATATVWQLSEPMGVVTVAALPISLLILEPYLAGVERARTVERRYYSELVHRLEERLRGTASDEDFVRSVRMWEKGMLTAPRPKGRGLCAHWGLPLTSQAPPRARHHGFRPRRQPRGGAGSWPAKLARAQLHSKFVAKSL